MIPAFSAAMLASESPRCRSWSSAMDVIAADDRGDDVGGIEASAESDLDHRHVHAGAAEDLECHGGRDFEKRRRGFQRAVAAERVGHVQDVAGSLPEYVAR